MAGRARSGIVIIAALALAWVLVPPAVASQARPSDAAARADEYAAAGTLVADPAPTATRTVRFVAGQHVGYRFDSSGRIVASKAATLVRPSSAPATSRRTIAGRGVHLLISRGIWSGYWVPESTLSYIVGIAGDARLPSTTVVTFTAGTYLGYRFDTAWNLLSAKPASLRRASSAHADRRAVVNGSPYIRIRDGIWAGLWMPGSASKPIKVSCAAGDRPAVDAPQVLRAVSGATGRVALTFDMGGRLDPARAILNQLLLARVCATIFPTGQAALSREGAAVLAVVRAHPELFEIGNHTMHHCDLRDGGGGASCPAARPGAAFVADELTSAAAVLVAATGQSPIPYWRPPYGSYDTAVRGAATSAGYNVTVLWSVDTVDWKPVTQGGPTANGIAVTLRTRLGAGGIALMHLGGYNTLDALPYALAGLGARGLTPTSVSGLLRAAP